MSSPRLHLVTWNDAQAHATREYLKERDHAPAVMVTIGWVLDHDKAGVSIACERWKEDGTWTYRGHTFIPAGMIISARPIRAKLPMVAK
jgi:hypothetical protein